MSGDLTGRPVQFAGDPRQRGTIIKYDPERGLFKVMVTHTVWVRREDLLIDGKHPEGGNDD